MWYENWNAHNQFIDSSVSVTQYNCIRTCPIEVIILLMNDSVYHLIHFTYMSFMIDEPWHQFIGSLFGVWRVKRARKKERKLKKKKEIIWIDSRVSFNTDKKFREKFHWKHKRTPTISMRCDFNFGQQCYGVFLLVRYCTRFCDLKKKQKKWVFHSIRINFESTNNTHGQLSDSNLSMAERLKLAVNSESISHHIWIVCRLVLV